MITLLAVDDGGTKLFGIDFLQTMSVLIAVPARNVLACHSRRAGRGVGGSCHAHGLPGDGKGSNQGCWQDSSGAVAFQCHQNATIMLYLGFSKLEGVTRGPE